jgi:hypothetical protein
LESTSTLRLILRWTRVFIARLQFDMGEYSVQEMSG